MTAADLLRVIVSTEDLDRSIEFYGGLLQLPALDRFGDFARFGLGERELLLHRRPVERGDASVAVGFAVTDLSSVVEGWRAGGGVVVDEPTAQPWGERMAVVRDPDGHIVCVSETA
jgi:catechol 2,3-dioxygenase-like lactoylglutathione lyase family enzyme